MPEHFINRQACTPREVFPGVVIRAFSGAQMTLARVELAPGAVVPEHSHPHEQVGYLVEGELEFTIAGQTERLQAGQMWCIPGGVAHRAVAGPRGAVALDIFHPTRPEYVGPPA